MWHQACYILSLHQSIMKPFFVTIAPRSLHLIIMPETETRMDGHPIITYSYSIFRREPSALNIRPSELNLHLPLKKKGNPDYLGYINYEEPGKIFSYNAEGEYALSREELEDVIEEINRYRSTPELWEI